MALFAPGQIAERRQSLIVDSETPGTACSHEIAVQFDNIPASSSAMQAIDILGDDHDSPGFSNRFELSEREVAGIGLDFAQVCSALVVESPDELGIPAKTVWGGHIFNSMTFPQPISVAKSRNAAFGRYSGAGQHHNSLRVLQQRGGASDGFSRRFRIDCRMHDAVSMVSNLRILAHD